ncbi:MAG: transporter [Rhizobiales bacterium]|nr:transporter [Rhizobacter sp.]
MQHVNPPTYGADPSGLICGYLINADEASTPVDCNTAIEFLDRHDAPGFVWLHFNLAHTGAMPWLRAHAGLNEAFFETLNDGLHSTRIERSEQTLIAVINDVHFDFAFEPSDIATLWSHVDQRLVITARLQPLRSVDKLRAAVKNGLALRSSAELLEHLMRAQADGLVEIVRGVTERVDRIEDQLLADRLDHRRARLGALRRLLVRLQRLLAPEPAALFRLLQHPPEWVSEADVQALREASEEFSVVLRDMTSLQERVKLLQEEIGAQVGEATNRSLFVLTIVTVLALPINILAGLFGMNVGGVPLADHPRGFWIVIVIVLTFTVIAGWIAFRRRRDN